MKITALILPTILLLLLASTTFADEQAHRQLALEFMELTEIEQVMEQSFSKAKTAQMRRIEVDYQGGDPEEVGALQEEVAEYLDEQLRFARVKNDFVKIYMDFFTEAELQSIVDFYKSPAIKKLKENDRELKLKLMKATQDQMQDLNFQIKKIKENFGSEQDKKTETEAAEKEEVQQQPAKTE